METAFLTTFLCKSSSNSVIRSTVRSYIHSAAHPTGSSIMILGGFGFLSRLHGLSIDNLVEVEMVLADGRIVVVSENEYPGIFPIIMFTAGN